MSGGHTKSTMTNAENSFILAILPRHCFIV